MSTFWNAYILCSPIFLLGACYLLFLWLALLYNIRKLSHKTRTIYLFHRNTNFLCFTSCLLCCVVDIVHCSLAYSVDSPVLEDQFNLVKGAADVLYYCVSCTLCIILFGRVYFTFKDTVFALSRCTILFFSTLISLSILVDLSYVTLVFTMKHESKIDIYARPMFILLILHDIFVSISMLYLFIYKLHELIVSINLVENAADIHTTPAHVQQKQQQQHCRQYRQLTESTMNAEEYCQSMRSPAAPLQSDADLSHTPMATQQQSIGQRHQSCDSEASSQSLLSQVTAITHSQVGDLVSIDLDEHQLNLIVVITRHTILSVFAIVFSQFFFVIGYLSLRSEWEEDVVLGILVYVTRLIGMCGIVTCLYLSMKFSKERYYQLCACCHLGCYKCCIVCVRNTIRNHILS